MAEKYTTNIIKVEEVADNTSLFTLERPDGFLYRAGQTIDLNIPSENGDFISHTFSLVSAPHEETLQVSTRMRDSEYKNTLSKLSHETSVTIEGPYGSFFLHQDVGKPAVFLVGGIGITPFVSMLRDASYKKLPHTFYLFYSNRRPEDAAFLNELMLLKEGNDISLTFIPTMTNIKKLKKDWAGETGYITWEMISAHVPSAAEPIYYMAGPQGLVTAMRTVLTENHVSEDAIRSEEFPGY